MPWNTPTLADVRRQARDYVQSYLPGADTAVPNSNLRVITENNAQIGSGSLLYLDWLALQIMVDTAEAEFLDRWAQIYIGGRKAATFSAGTITVTGINGTILPIASTFQGAGDFVYETTQQITIGALPTAVAVQSLVAGAGGNLEVGSKVSLLDAVSGVDGSATVVTLTGGTDIENDDDLRARVLFRIQQPPMGGSKTDYEQWLLSVPGVTRAWSAPLEMGIGTVTVRFMMDELRADPDPSIDGFPLPDDVITAALYLDSFRPVAVKDNFVVAPIPQPIDFTITGLTPDTTAIRAAIAAEVKAMMKEKAIPGQPMYRSWIDEAISSVVGEDHHELTYTTTAATSAGHLAVLGTITYA